MAKQAYFEIIVDDLVMLSGSDLSILQSISWTDNEEDNDTATITLDNKDGQIARPAEKKPVVVRMGWSAKTASAVFIGRVKKVITAGSASGRTMTINCESADSGGKIKERQTITYEDKTIQQMLDDFAKRAGIRAPRIDEAIGTIKRAREIVDGESFRSFAKRLARETGGQFKMVGDTPILAVPGSGKSVTGKTLTPFVVEWGRNLHTWSGLEADDPRTDFAEHVSRYFDNETGEYVSVSEGGKSDAKAKAKAAAIQSDETLAKSLSAADKAKAQQEAGGGSITCEGDNAIAQGVPIVLRGTKDGSDGTWRAKSVTQTLSASGWVAQISPDLPSDGAGTDKRKSKPKKSKSKPAGTSYANFYGPGSGGEVE